MVRSNLCLRKISKLAMRGLILVSVFWTDLVKTLPVDDKNMYETFLSANSNLKSCSNYHVSMLETDIFEGLCSLPTPNIKDYSQSQDKIIQAMKFNLAPLLCYTIFHNVYAVCHPDTTISIKPEPQSSKSGDQFCDGISPISLPETCTHWLDDPNHTSKDDCFLVNEVVSAVLNNKDFCENKCLVPDPDKKIAPSVNPLCEKLLDTSKILAQMAPKGADTDEKQGENTSSSQIDLSAPPGLVKQQEETKSIDPKEKVEAKDDLEPKSGEEVIGSNVDVVEGKATVKSEVRATHSAPNNKTKVVVEPANNKTKEVVEPANNKTKEVVEPVNNKSQVAVEPSNNKSQVAVEPNNNKSQVAVDPTGRADHALPSNASLTKDLIPSSNVTLKANTKTNNISSNTETIVEDIKISNKSSMTASDLDLESSGSFTSAFEFDYSSDSSPPTPNLDKELEVSNVDQNKEQDLSKPIAEKEIDHKGGIDSKALVSEEENKDDAEVANKKEDDVAEKPSKDVTISKAEPALPNAEKEIVETKYENNMQTGPEIDEQSSFFGYFILLSIVAIIAYLVFHNKKKILALVLEGRKRQGNSRRSGGREYRKLDSNLEDTMDPGKETSLRQVIY